MTNLQTTATGSQSDENATSAANAYAKGHGIRATPELYQIQGSPTLRHRQKGSGGHFADAAQQ